MDDDTGPILSDIDDDLQGGIVALGFDVDNNFEPRYVITKRDVVNKLKNVISKCGDVILAADEDREGEAIAASLAEELKLKKPIRIVFNEITKNAILDSINKIFNSNFI